MNIFRNKENAKHWEKKYFSLLNEHQASQKSHQDYVDLLRNTVVGLCSVACGVNKELDGYLERIRNLPDADSESDALRQELEACGEVLSRLSDSPSNRLSNAVELFIDFLAQHFPNRREQLEQVYSQYHNGQGLKLNDLLSALHDIVGQEQAQTSESQTHQIDESLIRDRLKRLLEDTEIPQPFNKQVSLLANRLLDRQESPLEILQAFFQLLLMMEKHSQQEQQNMTEFLTRLTEQLSELGQKTISIIDAHDQALKNRHLLDQSFSVQMLELQKKSSRATELRPLQQLVVSRIDSIEQQLRQHQQLEQKERKKHQTEFRELTQKIHRLESESSRLKNELYIAQYHAIYDPLTGLPNRLAYDERLKLEISRMKRHKAPLSWVIWDVDLFKTINDNFGHKAGDKALKILAKLLKNHCRETDFVCRFGGEEFVMLLSGTNAKSALVLAEKLRKIVSETKFSANGKKIAITISAGISEFGLEDSAETVFDRADRALYQAKRSGRNRCLIGL